MPSSQLKRLKASLREQGVIGPQQSKKQKRRNAQDSQGKNDKRLARQAALEGIREQFNPFQFKINARGPKFDVTTSKPASARLARGITGRPGVAKSVGEERRRETLLVEMQRRNKVGGILDRRFGEDDPTMAPEDKMLERFAREKQRAHKKGAMFDLEDDEPAEGLTHMGKSLSLDDDDDAAKDDFDEEDLFSDDDEMIAPDRRNMLKRLRSGQASDGEDGGDVDGDGEEGQPERKKTKQEVMKEVIAKSKLHKYERQAAKEADDDLRAQLDKELPQLQELLATSGQKLPDAMPHHQNGGSAPTEGTTGFNKAAFEKDYDLQIKKMAQDKRSRPTERTKSEEEKAEEQSQRLKELEEKRMKRMRGEPVSSDEEDGGDDDDEQPQQQQQQQQQQNGVPDFELLDGGVHADEYGLGKGIKTRPTAAELGFDDEDDFIIEDDLIASGSDLEPDETDEDSSAAEESEDESEDEFTKGLLTEGETKDPLFSLDLSARSQAGAGAGDDDGDGVPYTFPCPQTHQGLLDITETLPIAKFPVVVQRIRTLYHPRLDSKNKERLATFSRVLVQHVAHLGSSIETDVSPVLESVIRHVHSLAKSYPIDIANEFRAHIEDMEKTRPLSLNNSDLAILTAVGTIFPTSDHFHQVVTPAMLSMGRYMGQKIPQQLCDYAVGTYLSILTLQYQQLAKRYVPELMNFCLNALCALGPAESGEKLLLGFFPLHEPPRGIRVKSAKKASVRRLERKDCQPGDLDDAQEEAASLKKIAIMNTVVSVLSVAAETWSGKPAFFETFEPAVRVLKHLASKESAAHLPGALLQEMERVAAMLERMLKVAHLARRPLELHHHRPLAIKTAVPKFEDSFDPGKHYDPDRERAELAKLRAEHKKERKGAMRELRKDANFMARERLRLKREKDAAYEKKYKRIVAEIQGEEGREANAYEREKEMRKKGRR